MCGRWFCFAKTSLASSVTNLPEGKQKAKLRGVVEGSRSFLSFSRPLARYPTAAAVPSPPAFSRASDGRGHTAQGPNPASHPNVFAPLDGEASPQPRPSRSTALDWRGETCPGLEIVPCYAGEFPKLAPRCPVPPRCCDSEELN